MYPLVSVIIPNYNHARFLERRIDSVLNQTYPHFEVIILDDCSTDRSREVIEKYAGHPKVAHVVCNERNTGTPFAQWEKGLRLARGKYVWIAESDDYAAEQFLERTVEQLELHPSAVLCAANSHIVDADEVERENHYNDHVVKEPTLFPGKQYLKKYMYWGNRIYNASMVLFRKEMSENVSTDYTKMRYLGDYLFWMEIIRKGDVIELAEKLNYFRHHYSSTTKEGAGTGKNLRERLAVALYNYKNIKQPWYITTIHKKMLYHCVKHSKCDESTRKACMRLIRRYGINKKSVIWGGIVRAVYKNIRLSSM